MGRKGIDINGAYEALFEGRICDAKDLLKDFSKIDELEDFNILIIWGYIFIEEGDLERALLSQTRLLEVAKSPDEHHVAHHQMAMVLREKGKFTEALDHIKKEAIIIEESFPDDKLKRAVNKYEEGYLYLKLGDINQARDLLVQSLAFANSTDDLISQACAHRALGELNIVEKNEALARRHLKESKNLFIQAGDQVGENQIQSIIESI